MKRKPLISTNSSLIPSLFYICLSLSVSLISHVCAAVLSLLCIPDSVLPPFNSISIQVWHETEIIIDCKYDTEWDVICSFNPGGCVYCHQHVVRTEAAGVRQRVKSGVAVTVTLTVPRWLLCSSHPDNNSAKQKTSCQSCYLFSFNDVECKVSSEGGAGGKVMGSFSWKEFVPVGAWMFFSNFQGNLLLSWINVQL